VRHRFQVFSFAVNRTAGHLSIELVTASQLWFTPSPLWAAPQHHSTLGTVVLRNRWSEGHCFTLLPAASASSPKAAPTKPPPLPLLQIQTSVRPYGARAAPRPASSRFPHRSPPWTSPPPVSLCRLSSTWLSRAPPFLWPCSMSKPCLARARGASLTARGPRGEPSVGALPRATRVWWPPPRRTRSTSCCQSSVGHWGSRIG
jgi:hypothetical protein